METRYRKAKNSAKIRNICTELRLTCSKSAHVRIARALGQELDRCADKTSGMDEYAISASSPPRHVKRGGSLKLKWLTKTLRQISKACTRSQQALKGGDCWTQLRISSHSFLQSLGHEHLESGYKEQRNSISRPEGQIQDASNNNRRGVKSTACCLREPDQLASTSTWVQDL